MLRARREIGVREIPGLPSNPRVLEYHATTRLRAKNDSTSWCSSYCCWVFEGSDIRSTRSAAAISWLTWGKALDAPRKGCVVVVTRHDPKNPNAAHVGLYVGEDVDGNMLLLGGNQNDMVCIKPYAK